MEKNIKKIIHVSCLVSLLFTCNKIIGKNGTTQAIIPYVHLGENDTAKVIVPYVHLGKNGTTQIIVPYVHLGMSFFIGEASKKINKLMKKREERLIQTKKKEATDLHTFNEIKNILMSYISELRISILDENNNLLGVCDTKGWKQDETTRKEVYTVQQKLNLLIKSNWNMDENDNLIRICDTRGYKKDKAKKK